MAKKHKNNKKLGLRIGALILIFVFICVSVYGLYLYRRIYKPNVNINCKEKNYLYVSSKATYSDVLDSLYTKDVVANKKSFEWVVKKKNYHNLIKPGKYLLIDKMSNNELVDLLRSGTQETVKVVFNNIRTEEELAGKVAKYIEADSVSIIKLLKSENFAKQYGFNNHTFLTMFIPDTYEFYWNSSAEDFIKKMATSYKSYWNSNRVIKAKNIGLTQSEVSILASIVQKEQSVHRDERSLIAGLYMNRLKKGMKLESDPTVVYGVGDFTIKRVLNKHLENDSPYNTYKYIGLPPGPICLPEVNSIDAVLNYKKHDYLFMCAKDDMSGYHSFSKTYSQHLIYAKKYRRALNKMRIYN